jgi:hypothetical protein
MKEGEERKVRLRTKEFIVRLTSACPSDEPQTFNVIFTRVSPNRSLSFSLSTPKTLSSHSKKTQKLGESFVSFVSDFVVLCCAVGSGDANVSFENGSKLFSSKSGRVA